MYLFVNLTFIVICIFYAFCGEKHLSLKQRRFVLGLLVCAYSTIMAFRPESTPDTAGYISSFCSIQKGDFFIGNIFQKYSGYEFGFVFLIKCFKLFSDNFRLFFFLIALIGTACTVKGLTDIYTRIGVSGNKGTSAQIFSLYISFFGILYNGISLRAGFAVGFGFLFLEAMLRNKYALGVLLLIIAVTNHRTAFLFIIIYLTIRLIPVLPVKVHFFIWSMIGLLLISGIGQTISSPILALLISLFNRYQVSSVNYLMEIENAVGMTDILMWIIYGFFIALSLKNEYYRRYLNVIMVGAFLVLTMYGVRAISRAWDLFYMMMVPMTCALFHQKAPKIKRVAVQRGLLVLLLVVRLYKMLSMVF